MNKNYNIIIMIIIVVSVAFNVQAAVVSDNDGSAFITKSEFDSLKNVFQSQINGYNTQLDSKIDTAIAGYLSGIKVTTTTTRQIVCSNLDEVSMLNSSTVPTYEYGRLGLEYGIEYFRWLQDLPDLLKIPVGATDWDPAAIGISSSSWMSSLNYWCYFKCNPTASKKVLIGGEEKNGSDWISSWEGYADNTEEKISGFMYSGIDSRASGNMNNYLFHLKWIPSTDKNTIFMTRTDLFKYNFGASGNDGLDIGGKPDYQANAATFNYHDIKYSNICLYDDGNYSGNFSIKNSTDYLLNDYTKTETRSNWRSNITIASSSNFQFSFGIYSYGTWKFNNAFDESDCIYNPTISDALDSTYGAPQFGFSPKITTWKQLYNPNLKNILYQDGSGNVTEKYIYLKDGLPLIQALKEQKIKYTFKFGDTGTYNVYLKYGKFGGEPQESECINIKYKDVLGNLQEGQVAKIYNGTGTIEWEDRNITDLVYVKWTKDGEDGVGKLVLTGDQKIVTYESLTN